VVLVLAVLGAYLLVAWPLRDPHPRAHVASGVIAVRGARILTSPDESPIENGTLVARDGVITAVGPDVPLPPGARVLPCNHCTVAAGFWNAHVHFTEEKWAYAAWKGKATLDEQLTDMLTRRGFTTVVDAGSDPRRTISLRRRIESGELLGPAIYTAASSIFPPGGIPYYLRNALPSFVLWMLPQPAGPEAAARTVERNVSSGADLTKLFTGSRVERGKVLPMSVPIAAAAVEAAHRHGQLVYSHASNLAGTEVAIRSGVDVLAHAPDSTDGIDAALLRAMADRKMAMIPTLKMFATTVTSAPGFMRPILEEVREFHRLGGQLLFGTDVGYMTDYRTEDEFRLLAEAGVDAPEILRMLTSGPARRFGVAGQKGSIVPGASADFVLLDGNPLEDLGAFSRVVATVRSGRVLHAQQ
jgi:imidazolonepropionase-like amidohydrolase